ncbi:MAG: type II toxin-antitoxin system RelE/ParE family toxin [Vicingaceae bacterium]
MKIRLSSLAAYKLELLVEYLEERWSSRVKLKFLKKLEKSLNVAANNPNVFPHSQIRPELRKLVITKQATALYLIDSDSLFVITIFDTRQDPNEIDKEIKKHFG